MKHNFGAGPCILPQEVFKQAADAVLDFNGLSILEVSHRHKDYVAVMDEALDLVKKALNVPAGYSVAYLQGGATLGFTIAALNMMRESKKAAYINTGTWASGAIKEAKKAGIDPQVITSSEDKQFTYIPKNFEIPSDLDYLHFTSNNTIYGTQFHNFPKSSLPLVCDMSSDIASRVHDFSKFDLIYAGAQKNLGPAGTTLFIVKDEIYVIEVNPRASRTVPFVSKAKGLPLAKIASRVMAGEKLSKFNLKNKNKNLFAVKEAVFPFNKFPNSDLLLGPEMKSTGEVMGFDKDFGMAYAKSQIAASNSLPTKGLAFISLKDGHKDEGVDLAKQLLKLNFTLCATGGTADYIRKHGIKCKTINKVSGGSPHIVDVLNSKKIALVINTGGGNSEHRLHDAMALRRATLGNKVPYCTNMSTAQACLEAIKSLKTKKLEVTALQDI